MSYKTMLAAFALGTAATFSSFASLANQANQITVSDPYAREVPPGAPASASFMTIKNSGDSEVKIVSADSEVSKIVELHTHTNDNGVMRMRQIPFISVPAQGQTMLKPGGLHIMLIGPHQPLKTGQSVTVTLEFEDGSEKAVSMPVRSLKGMGMGMGMGMKHSNSPNHSMH